MWASRETGGGQRGSALCPVPAQQWEAVFRRERRPASLDRFFQQAERGETRSVCHLAIARGKRCLSDRFLPANSDESKEFST